MPRKSTRKFSMKGQIKGATEVLRCIRDHGPRDGDNELMEPYRTWAGRLDRDLAKLNQWMGTEEPKLEC